MPKPALYLDTSIISAYWYEGADVTMLARRLNTREWWESERRYFSVVCSTFAELELRSGSYARQTECVKMVRRLRYVPDSGAVGRLTVAILAEKVVPPSKGGDAAQLAVAAVNAVDYLLTWNYAHMANPAVQARFNVLCEKAGLVAPLMVSPETIPQVRFGQSVRRSR